MSEAPTTSQSMQEHLSATPSVLHDLTAAHTAARDAVDPRLYDLCRLRVAMLLENHEELVSEVVSRRDIVDLPQWPSTPRFTETERACLAFTEQFVIDVASMPDDIAIAVVEQLGADGFSDFVHALLVIEQRQRLCLIWDRLFGGLQP